MATRNTRQKQIVTQVLEKADTPLTIQEILAAGQKIVPTLGLATVYREINRLCGADELQTVTIPGDPVRYETHKHHHHHFKCNKCGMVYEIEGCASDLRKLIPKGFKAQNHDLTFYGLCRICV